MAVTPNPRGNYYERQAYRESRKAEIAAEKAAAAARAMTCQVCGRAIFAQTGAIAHHGYERPGTGWQTASCPGAKRLPFEVAKKELLLHIKYHAERLENMLSGRQEVAKELAPVTLRWQDRDNYRTGRKGEQHYLDVTRANFDELKAANSSRFLRQIWYDFDRVLSSDLAQRDSLINMQRDYIAMQQARADGWRQTHRVGGEGEAVWVAL